MYWNFCLRCCILHWVIVKSLRKQYDKKILDFRVQTRPIRRVVTLFAVSETIPNTKVTWLGFNFITYVPRGMLQIDLNNTRRTIEIEFLPNIDGIAAYWSQILAGADMPSSASEDPPQKALGIQTDLVARMPRKTRNPVCPGIWIENRPMLKFRICGRLCGDSELSLFTSGESRHTIAVHIVWLFWQE